jgi:hypothetical protein
VHNLSNFRKTLIVCHIYVELICGGWALIYGVDSKHKLRPQPQEQLTEDGVTPQNFKF